eukprot:jgi/Orpsp1_1/1185687/evm.model.c7180000094847.2
MLAILTLRVIILKIVFQQVKMFMLSYNFSSRNSQTLIVKYMFLVKVMQDIIFQLLLMKLLHIIKN